MQKKPDLNEKVAQLYCEGNTLRGIQRILGCSYTTVLRKFHFMAQRARKIHNRQLQTRSLPVSDSIQIDEIKTFVVERYQALGIQLAVSQKTRKIISAKVAKIASTPTKSVSKELKAKWTAQSTRRPKIIEMMHEIRMVANKNSILKCDGDVATKSLASWNLPELKFVTLKDQYEKMWDLNHIAAKMRHHMSRMKRKSWATTKNIEGLQRHLDLFIAYQNGYFSF